MSAVIITPNAALGLERCRLFLAQKSQLAARRAADTIKTSLQSLEAFPEIGRPYSPELGPHLRELVIPFGDSAYVALYRYDAGRDVVYLLALRHAKEAGY